MFNQTEEWLSSEEASSLTTSVPGSQRLCTRCDGCGIAAKPALSNVRNALQRFATLCNSSSSRLNLAKNIIGAGMLSLPVARSSACDLSTRKDRPEPRPPDCPSELESFRASELPEALKGAGLAPYLLGIAVFGAVNVWDLDCGNLLGLGPAGRWRPTPSSCWAGPARLGAPAARSKAGSARSLVF